jgi:muramoyltetrapeptide carboxypeptidase
MKRKNFIKTLSITSAIPFISPVEKIYTQASLQSIKTLKPKRLKAEDTVALVAPGSYISENELNESIQNIEGLGFNTTYNSSILSKTGYFSGSDQRRADELMEMFSGKDVDGIVCVRGGYGCSRILPLLDFDVIKNNPKVLIGYSDVTALLYGIYSQAGLVCFHGPVGISTFNDFSVRYLKNTLVYPHDNLELISELETGTSYSESPVVISNGIAEGELIGGNLSIVVSMIGTPYDVDYEGKIVFLEETGEEPYRIDRMLTQMIQTGKFDKAAGIALGIFDKCEPKEKDPAFSSSFSLMEVLLDRLSDLGIPVIYGLSFGHIKNKFTLPFGIKAELNVDNYTLSLLEKAVI